MSSGQNQFLVLSAESRPAAQPVLSQFLSLAPDVSASHPRTQRSRADSDVSSSSSAESSGSSSPTLTAVQEDQSNPAVAVSNTRVLKLSPVHWGAHAEDHQGDYHDVAAKTV